MTQQYKSVITSQANYHSLAGLVENLLPVNKRSISIVFFVLISFISSINLSGQTNCSCWKTIDTSFHVVPFSIDSDGDTYPTGPLYRNDDASTLAFKIPFNFCFWGTPMDTVYINNNGTVSFHQAYSSFVPVGFPLTNYDMIAPFWADVDTHPPIRSGVVYYKLTPTYLVVQWDTVGYFNNHADKRNSFQVIMSNGSDPIIPNGNNVEFCYQTMQWTTGDASGGTRGFGGSPATVGANKGDGTNYVQFGLFDTAGTRYLGAYPPLPYDGVGWLDNQSFIFSTCVSNIGPIVKGVSPCDTFVLCTGDTALIHILFISPKSSDSSSAGILPPILPGETIVSNTPGNTDSIIIRIIGGPGNYGFHTINVYGYTTNTHPPDTTFSSFVLEVDSNAVGSILASRDTICPGDSVKLKAVANVNTYLWSTGQTTDSIEVKPAVTTTYTLQLKKGKCDLILTKTIVVLKTFSPTITAKDSVCKGDSVTFTATGGGTYKWNPGGASTSSITVKISSTTTYSVLVTSGCNGDTMTLSKTVHAISPPVVITSHDTTICTGGTATLSASGGANYLWSPGGATSSSINVSPGSTTTYTVAVSNGNCAKDTTITVTVQPPPIPTISANPDSICIGDSALLTGGGGGTYFWPTLGSSNSTVWVKPLVTTTYILQVTKNGCTSTTTIKVVVSGSFPTSISLAKDSLCQGDSTTLTATGGTYKWLIPGNPTSATITVKPSSTTTYSVVITTPCGKDTLSKTLHIILFPVVTTSGNKTICRGSTASISASGATSYVWSPGGSTSSSINVSPANTTTYTVVLSNGKCFKDTTITVTVDTPAVLTITPPQKLCFGDSVTLTATGGPSYKWSTGATTSSIIVKPSSTTTYTCVVNKNGCIDSTTTSVTVDVPNLLACCDTTIIKGASATINAYSATNYLWSPNSSLSCDTCATTIATPTVTTTYTVLTKDAAGCTIERLVTVIVEIPCADFIVPNIFTPNNDGRNDDFVINILNPASYSITIYDRWGAEVYTSTDPTVYWNGKMLNTDYLVPDGVYYYILKASCGSNNYVKKGFVQVVGGN